MERAGVQPANRCAGETTIRPRHYANIQTLRNDAAESMSRWRGGSQTARSRPPRARQKLAHAWSA
eukprot:3236594-Lingulodinium_polyedra.AAC.1